MFIFRYFFRDHTFISTKASHFSGIRAKRTILYGSIVLFSLAIISFLFPPFHYDDSNAIKNTPVASDTTLSLSVDNDVLSLDLTPLSANGTFASTATPATIRVATNNVTGYTLGIRTTSSSDVTTKLLNNIDECVDTPISTKCSLSSLDTAVSPADYEATTSTDLNNTWGYLPSKYHSADNTDYLPAPSYLGDVINKTSSPNTADPTTGDLIEDEFTINLGARLDFTPYAGQYSGTLIVTAVGNPVPYSVSYDSNIPAPASSLPTPAEVSNMPSAQAGEVSSGSTVSVMLSPKVPSLGNTDPSTGQYVYAGYGFMGWCSEPTEIIVDGTGKDYQYCPSTADLYQPGEHYGIDQTKNNTEMLYAVWGYATVISFDSNAPATETTGTMPDQIIASGVTTPLTANNFSRSGYYFGGWGTTPSAYQATYTNSGNYTAASSPVDTTLYAIWTDCPPNTICYDDNGANSPITMSYQTSNYGDNTNPITSNMEINLWPMNYKYDTTGDGYNDYGFVGWSMDQDAADHILDTNPDNDPPIYGPNQNITLGDVSESGVKLYAVWLPVAKDSTSTDLTFQTTNLLTTTLEDGTTLASKPNGYATALRDQRDNQVYAVAKLADENYWMIENMRLDNNPDHPDWGDPSLSQGFGGVFQGLANAESSNFSNNTTANSLYSTNNITGDYQAIRFPRYNNVNTSSPVTNMTTYSLDDNIYSLGNYYTWSAAIADTTDYSTDGGHTNVPTSICPAGWHLPYGNDGTSGDNLGNTSGGFYYLGSKIGGTSSSAASSRIWRSFPNNFIYSGSFGASSAGGRSTDAYYWSSSSMDNDGFSYLLGFYRDFLYPGTFSNFKFYGESIRCIAE